jgi:hypothetical protein
MQVRSVLCRGHVFLNCRLTSPFCIHNSITLK